MAVSNYIKKEVVFEGKSKYLIDLLRKNGVNAFLRFSLENNLPVNMVDTAFKSSGILMQPNGEAVYLKAVDFYKLEMRKRGLERVHIGMGVREQLKNLDRYRFKASFLVDANLNLMPEVVVNKNTGMFVSINNVTNNLYDFYRGKGSTPIYQILCSYNSYQAAYIVDVDGAHEGMQFYQPKFTFYQPNRIDPTKDLSTLSNGLFTTLIPCQKIENKTIRLLNNSMLWKAIQIRVAAELFPDQLAVMR